MRSMRSTPVRPALAALTLGAALAAPGLWSAPSQAAGHYTCNGKTATIVGTSHHDVLHGTKGDDVIVGLGGPDTIYGGGGNDTICGNDQADKIFGGQGDDVIKGGKGGDHLHGQLGNDTVKSDLPGSTVGGTIIPDTLTADAGNDTWLVSDPSDLLSFTSASAGVQLDLAAGTATGSQTGTDRITLAQPTAGIYVETGKGPDTVLGSAGPDHLTDRGGSNTVDGRDGDDTITMGKGTNHVDGSAGNDTISGKFNSYSVYHGDDGTDTITVQGSHDQVYGDAGDDTISLTSAVWPDNLLDGGTGRDALTLDLQKQASTSAPYAGLTLDLQADTLTADATTFPVTDFENADLADLSQNQGLGPVATAYAVVGNAADNTLKLDVTGTGAPGGTLRGLAGDDTLTGGDGNDTLDGGAGTDSGDGRGGTDTCISVEKSIVAGQQACEQNGGQS